MQISEKASGSQSVSFSIDAYIFSNRSLKNHDIFLVDVGHFIRSKKSFKDESKLTVSKRHDNLADCIIRVSAGIALFAHVLGQN